MAVHYYEPHIFTHQGASWVGWDHPNPPKITFPGTVPDLKPFVDKDHYGYEKGGMVMTVEAVQEEFKHLAEWAAKRNVELHLGEFGVYEPADPESRERWYRTIVDACEKHGIGWAVWDYKCGFAVRDAGTGEPTLVQKVMTSTCSKPYFRLFSRIAHPCAFGVQLGGEFLDHVVVFLAEISTFPERNSKPWNLNAVRRAGTWRGSRAGTYRYPS